VQKKGEKKEKKKKHQRHFSEGACLDGREMLIFENKCEPQQTYHVADDPHQQGGILYI
jgi:hypothetical protein